MGELFYEYSITSVTEYSNTIFANESQPYRQVSSSISGNNPHSCGSNTQWVVCGRFQIGLRPLRQNGTESINGLVLCLLVTQLYYALISAVNVGEP